MTIKQNKTSGDPGVLGYIHSTESFGAVDGPGIRFVVFMQGCDMRCMYCHNPDTWKTRVGRKRSAAEVLSEALQYRDFWGKDGGITLSGGEILLQPDFALDLFRRAKDEGVHTCLDTSGHPFTREEPFFSLFRELMTVTDLLLVDIKEIDPEKHRKLTGFTNENILDMCRYLSSIGKPIWIRHVLVPGVTDNDEDLKKLNAFIQTLTNVKRVEILPYHTMGIAKYHELGIRYRLEGVDPPTDERIRNAEELLHCADYRK
ncbi:pyruvate formate-lyase-activating protein [Sporolactobacillus sp. THM19-2]|jgi:pyruvate formate lyase activating enzyme|uniref:pyruvate formate-lyase-activating protein n=1 Tax=Sporolactobacillus sp. THM19-2 TaxID=2511171 RepID=UPI0010200023|nr:pyruvate formate-lyase-activating protein [Sporolactobacillus sp. THM19-2]RYL92236.1 pyruvate formate lyase-activating protein [Sporolactobacillus sp. THM19-2]